ncbi:MAG: DNA-directed RNA polymerase subunit beta', partial [Myxococcales bacterium]|nr:DNA-directed RNA polymerase subunit beta' [Myxococcales bacterium]
RFRQNLLGKRVDYSGRSVIVVGPDLALDECGLPKRMALELFKPFVMRRLVDHGHAHNIKAAKRLVERVDPKVWDVLEEVIQDYVVLLNRAPTLHRLGIQAFKVRLIEGSAIQIHPLVCAAFNADFDGDQMAVHVPLSVEAQMEARVLMMSTNNILSPASGKPIINPTQDIVLGLYYATRERKFAKGSYREGSLTVDKKGQAEGYLRGVFASVEEVRMAYDAGEVALHAGIKVRVPILDEEGKPVLDQTNRPTRRLVETTVGRVLISEVLPPKVGFDHANKVLNKKALTNLIDTCYRAHRNKETVLLADRLRTLGFEHATRAGISICMDHMVIPDAKKHMLADAQGEVEKVIEQYQEGLITDGERYNKIVDIWADVADRVTDEMMLVIGSETMTDPETGKSAVEPSFNPIYIMADSGARGSKQQIRQLAAMRGLMARPSGEIIEQPITANFREGLSVLEYFSSTHGARKGLADTALKTANSGYLTRRLVDVAQDAVIADNDCGTLNGVRVSKLEEAGEVIQSLGDRILGRVTLEDVIDPLTGEVLIPHNTELGETEVKAIEDAGIEEVNIRSVLACEARRGICGLCYGRDLARGYRVNVGEAVGIIAAQSIGEPGTQLTMRTFHVGGTAARGKIEASYLEARTEGTVRLRRATVQKKKDGTLVIMNRHAELVVVDDTGREREHNRLVYGATLKKNDGEKCKAGELLAEWDQFAIPMLTEVSGIVKFGDLEEGVTVQERLDEVTGLSRKVVIESKSADLRPRISIKDPETGNTLKLPGLELDARYLLPVGAHIVAQEGDTIEAGDIIAKMPRDVTKVQDITGGLPRVAELFEARKPKDHAIITEIDGVVSFGKDTKGKRKVLITPASPDGGLVADQAREYLIPKGKHIQVQPGDRVRAGDPLQDGPPNPHDILRVKGEKELAAWLVNEIQQVYRLQGVGINDKHIEVIVRQMLKRVRVKEVGDTSFLVDEQVEKHVFEAENEKVIARGGRPAIAEALLLGITKASLSTESFISASSFQETTKVLTEAAICGKTDDLRGLKENVIMGRLIPAGTGLPAYKRLNVVIDGEAPVYPREQPPRARLDESLVAVGEE